MSKLNLVENNMNQKCLIYEIYCLKCSVNAGEMLDSIMIYSYLCRHCRFRHRRLCVNNKCINIGKYRGLCLLEDINFRSLFQ